MTQPAKKRLGYIRSAIDVAHHDRGSFLYHLAAPVGIAIGLGIASVAGLLKPSTALEENAPPKAENTPIEAPAATPKTSQNFYQHKGSLSLIKAVAKNIPATPDIAQS